MSNAFVRRFQNNSFSHQLFSYGDKIVIGVSGGPDSVCLVRVLYQLKKKCKLELSLVHVNYGLRGNQSDKDEQFVGELATKLDLPLKSFSFKKANQKKKNLEEAMREFRYELFEKVREERGYDWIAVAHNMDDQAETFFLNLFRGAGAQGLGGMSPKRGRVIRPLLFFSREEILVFLKRINQQYRTDKTNKDVSFLRNRIRRRLIPLLEKTYSPNIKKQIAFAMDNLRSNHEIVEEIIDKEYNRIAKKVNGQLVIDGSLAGNIPSASLRYLFRKAILDIKGDLKDISFGNYKEFEKVLRSNKSKKQVVKMKGIAIERSGNIIKIQIVKSSAQL